MATFQRELLIGQWYRIYDEEGDQQNVEYAHLLPDGSFEFTFITQTLSGEVLEQVIELGDWGLVGDIHFTITKSEFIDQQHYAADLADGNNYHAYKVLNLDNKTFTYQHVLSQETFQLKRLIEQSGNC